MALNSQIISHRARDGFRHARGGQEGRQKHSPGEQQSRGNLQSRKTRPDIPNMQGSAPLVGRGKYGKGHSTLGEILSLHISRPPEPSSERSDRINGDFKQKGSLGMGEHLGAFSKRGCQLPEDEAY